jgi:murein DD-endopeptidase MepM/ murein hydrolase activator NlpD
MTSPRTDRITPPRARGTAVAVGAALVLASLFAAPQVSADDIPKELKEAKKELRQTQGRIREGEARLRKLQKEMNRLATSISRTEQRLIKARERIDGLERETHELELEADRLEAELNERNREAYMMGTSQVMYVLTATSAAEAASRMGFLNEMSRRDEALAAEVAVVSERLASARVEVSREWQVVEISRLGLVADRRALWKKMERFRELIRQLNIRLEQIKLEISRLRPLGVCPVGGPHAIADNFGAPRHEPGGGFHWHQGDDIMAAMGTPILAPFDGVASASHSELGGISVYVHGEFGYVYNAHLSRLGGLGPVETGDVIGYVGSTGFSSGPHLHFEWHPDGGEAIDPYDLLMQVC